jgi:hypothetical protein
MVSNVHHQLDEHGTPTLPFHEVDALAFLPGWRERPSYLDDLVRPAHQNAWVLDSSGDAPVRDLLCSRADRRLAGLPAARRPPALVHLARVPAAAGP